MPNKIKKRKLNLTNVATFILVFLKFLQFYLILHSDNLFEFSLKNTQKLINIH